VGGFVALPKLDAGFEYNDNIYAVQTGQKSDTIFTANPELDLQSNWSRNALSAYVRGANRSYAHYSSESTFDYQVGGQGRLDAGDGAVSLGGDTGLLTEPRTSPSTTSGTVHPVRYQQSDFFAMGSQTFNRVRLTGRFDLNDFDYHNGHDPSNHVVVEDDRDRTVYTYSGKAEYALSPDAAVFVNGSYNQHHYRLAPPSVVTDKDSDGGQVNVGASFDLTHLLRGDVQVGYLDQHFSSSTFRPVSGFSALATVEWFPSDLTTVTVTGSRQIQDASTAFSAVFIAGVAGVQVDHELLRNLILTARYNYENDAYKGTDRNDTISTVFVGARYMMNRFVGVTGGYTYIDEGSSGAQKGPIYKVNKFNVALNLKF
jgi:hypothetical protein